MKLGIEKKVLKKRSGPSGEVRDFFQDFPKWFFVMAMAMSGSQDK